MLISATVNTIYTILILLEKLHDMEAAAIHIKPVYGKETDDFRFIACIHELSVTVNHFGVVRQ